MGAREVIGMVEFCGVMLLAVACCVPLLRVLDGIVDEERRNEEETFRKLVRVIVSKERMSDVSRGGWDAWVNEYPLRFVAIICVANLMDHVMSLYVATKMAGYPFPCEPSTYFRTLVLSGKGSTLKSDFSQRERDNLNRLLLVACEEVEAMQQDGLLCVNEDDLRFELVIYDFEQEPATENEGGLK